MVATQTTASAAPARVLGAPTAELKFRILGGEHHGRILRIAGAKCTIGSAPGCTLRLRGGDVEALHCLILTGRNGTIIRRNSPRTYLNGGPFDDAALKTGDVLRISSIELEVLACPEAASIFQPRPLLAPENPNSTFLKQEKQRLEGELVAIQEQLLVARDQLEHAQLNNVEASAEHALSMDQLRAQHARGLESLLSQQREERTKNLAREEQFQNELRQVQQNAQELESRLTEREAAFQQQLEGSGQEVQTLQQTTRSQQIQWEQERTALCSERQQLAEKMVALEGEIREQASELQTRQETHESLEEQVRALENQLQATRQETGERQQRLEDQRQQERLREQEEFTAARSRLEDSISQLTEQVRQREAQLADVQQRGGECASTLTVALDNARCDLRELQIQRSRKEEEESAFHGEVEGRIADLTARLVEREKELAHYGEELIELRQRAAHVSAAESLVQQLEETLAASVLAQQTERQTWQQERSALECQRNDIESQRIILEAAQTELHNRREAAESRTNELSSQCIHWEAKYSALQAECNSVQAQCAALEIQRAELEAQASLAQQTAGGQAAGNGQTVEFPTNLYQQNPGEAAEQVAQENAAQQYEQQVEKWQSEALKWQLQAEEVAVQLDEFKQLCTMLETEIAEFKKACSAAAPPPEGEGIESLRGELESQRKEMADARTQFQEEQSQLGRLLAETSAREEVLARFESELRERQAAWEAARSEQAGALEERSQLIASQITQFEAEQAAFTRQQAAIIQQMSSLEDRVQELTAASESRPSESPVVPQLDDQSLVGLEIPPEQQHNLEDLPLESPAMAVADVAVPEPVAVEPSPDEVESVVNRLMDAGVWKGNEGDSQESSESPAEVPAAEDHFDVPLEFAAQPAESSGQEEVAAVEEPSALSPLSEVTSAQPPAATPSYPGSSDDDSIEQYMSRLLSRVRGSDAHGSQAVHQSQFAPVKPSQPIAPPAASENPDEPKEYVPRTQAPEMPERLSLMRELANSAANSAIDTHARQHQKRDTKQKSLVALLSFIGFAGLLVVAIVNRSPIAMIGSGIFVAVCCVMSMRAIAGSFRQMRLTPTREIGESQEARGDVQKSEQV